MRLPWLGRVDLYAPIRDTKYGLFARKRQEYWLRVHVGLFGILLYRYGSANVRDRQTTTRAEFNDVAGRWIPDEVADAMEEELFDKRSAKLSVRDSSAEVKP